jgi:hypothetical protein
MTPMMLINGMMSMTKSTHIDMAHIHVHAHASDLIHHVALRQLIGMCSRTSGSSRVQHLLAALRSKVICISLEILVLLCHLVDIKFV